jgi:endoglucanase
VLPASRGEPAFQRGVSIAHWMAKVHDAAGPGAPWFGAGDIAWIAAQGFDHIRYPLDGRLIWRTDGTLDEAALAPLVRAMHATRDAGLGAVLDLHFLPGGRFDRDAQDPAIYSDPRARAEAAACWARLAARFAGEGPYLRFELINEPAAARASDLNTLNAALLGAIRLHDRERVVYITTNRASCFATLAELVVPADPRVAVTLHYDEPLVFTHQRAAWKQCPPDMPLVEFPGRVPDLRGIFPPDHFAHRAALTELSAAAVDADFERVAAWLRAHAPGREVYLGGFGVNESAPAASRTRYIRAVRAAAERRGWGWCVWSYNGGMAVRDAAGGATPILAGLFDPPAGGAAPEAIE